MSTFDRLLALSALQKSGDYVYEDSELRQMIEELRNNEIKHINQDGTMTIDDLVALGDGVYYIDNEISVEFEEANGNIGSVYIVGLTTVAYEGKNIYCIPLEGTLFLSERLNPETGEPTGETYWTFNCYVYFSDYNELEARVAALESIGNAEEGAY